MTQTFWEVTCHICSDMSFCDQFQPVLIVRQNWCSLMIPEHPRVCSCADCIPDRREAFIFTADKDQLPDSIGLTSRFYKHAKNSTWQKHAAKKNLNEESRFEKTVFEKTRKRKITCRSFCNHTFLFGVAVVFLFRMLAFSHFFFRLRGFG